MDRRLEYALTPSWAAEMLSKPGTSGTRTELLWGKLCPFVPPWSFPYHEILTRKFQARRNAARTVLVAVGTAGSVCTLRVL